MNCPICRQPSQEKYQPFCSGYCADLDLLRWLNQEYRISSPLSSEESTAPNRDDEAEQE